MSDDNELTTCSCVFSFYGFVSHSVCYFPLCVWCVGVMHMLSIIKVYTVSLISGCVIN